MVYLVGWPGDRWCLCVTVMWTFVKECVFSLFVLFVFIFGWLGCGGVVTRVFVTGPSSLMPVSCSYKI